MAPDNSTLRPAPMKKEPMLLCDFMTTPEISNPLGRTILPGPGAARISKW